MSLMLVLAIKWVNVHPTASKYLGDRAGGESVTASLGSVRHYVGLRHQSAPAFCCRPPSDTRMRGIAGPLLAFMLALASTPAEAQAGATPAPPGNRDSATAGEARGGSVQPTADDICHALEQSAAENALPVEFFARVIWQESRFDALATSPKGAAGIAQFMPATASWHGLADPFNPIESLERR